MNELKILDNNHIETKKKIRHEDNIIKGNRYRAVCYCIIQKKKLQQK